MKRIIVMIVLGISLLGCGPIFDAFSDEHYRVVADGDVYRVQFRDWGTGRWISSRASSPYRSVVEEVARQREEEYRTKNKIPSKPKKPDNEFKDLDDVFSRANQVIRDMVDRHVMQMELLLEITAEVEKGNAIRQTSDEFSAFRSMFYIKPELFKKYKRLKKKHMWFGGLGVAGLYIRPMSEYEKEATK